LKQKLSEAPQGAHAPTLDDFSFFGFDNLKPQIKRLIQRVEIRDDTPGVTVAEDSVYVPARQSGLLRREREVLAGDLGRGNPAEPVREVDEEVVYLGWLFNHYGHFLMQSLARVWFLSEVAPSVRVVFHHASRPGWQPAPWALRMLEAFGVPRERIMVLREPTRLRRMIVPEPLFEPRSVSENRQVRAHLGMARPYRAVAERIAGPGKPSTQPVYLSRRLLPGSQRLIVGEGELEDVLRYNGFRIAHPQTMSFEDQVRLINEHTEIVSNAGSAAQNVLFALHAPRLHLLTNGPNFSPDYFMHASLVGSETSFINCLSTGGRESFPGNQKQTPHLLDAPTLLDYLKQRGLLPKSVPVSPIDRGAPLSAEYDEAWLYGRMHILGPRDEALPAEIEREAERFASASWPVSLSLARYYASRDVARAEQFAAQFVTLAEAERQPARLARYRSGAEELAQAMMRCCPETAKQVAAVVASRFHVTLESLTAA
jgi:hypothetical protein